MIPTSNGIFFPCRVGGTTRILNVLLEPTRGDRFNVKQWVTMLKPQKRQVAHVIYKASNARNPLPRFCPTRCCEEFAIALSS